MTADEGRSTAAERHADAVATAVAARDYDRVVEVGVGDRLAVARRLAERGLSVRVVDLRPVETPDGVVFRRDDVTDPDRSVYADADALYALRLPPDLHRPVADLARSVGADLVFTTLGGDPATVSTRPETVAGGTLHWVHERGKPSGGR